MVRGRRTQEGGHGPQGAGCRKEARHPGKDERGRRTRDGDGRFPSWGNRVRCRGRRRGGRGHDVEGRGRDGGGQGRDVLPRPCEVQALPRRWEGRGRDGGAQGCGVLVLPRHVQCLGRGVQWQGGHVLRLQSRVQGSPAVSKVFNAASKALDIISASSEPRPRPCLSRPRLSGLHPGPPERVGRIGV